MNAGYESLVWISDKDGKEYVCALADVRSDHELNEDEKAKCMDVNLLVGTERW